MHSGLQEFSHSHLDSYYKSYKGFITANTTKKPLFIEDVIRIFRSKFDINENIYDISPLVECLYKTQIQAKGKYYNVHIIKTDSNLSYDCFRFSFEDSYGNTVNKVNIMLTNTSLSIEELQNVTKNNLKPKKKLLLL